MRVISGTARGRHLVTCRDRTIRPTGDRVKEALFSIIYSLMGPLDGMQVVDLYAGSGALGIEALSRGAAHCLFVDRSRTSCDLVRANLMTTELLPRASIWCKQASEALKALSREGVRFHLLLMDPPYDEKQAVPTLQTLASTGVVAIGGLLVVETGSREQLPDRVGDLVRVDHRQYGSAALTFFRMEQGA